MAKKEVSKKEATEKLTSFLALAFCIDGKAEWVRDTTIFADGREIESAIFKLTDSKRGTFYVTLSI